MRKAASIVAVLAVWCGAACGERAHTTVIGQGALKSSMDFSGLTAAGANGALFRKTLENDLARSGYFTVSTSGAGAYQVAGSCADGGGGLSVRCQVRDRGKSYLDKTYSEDGKKARRLAHKVADEILLAVKGVKGIASTRIAMVGNVGGKKDLYLCDADGGGLTRLTQDGAPCIAPRWSPDGNSLIYTSYRNGSPALYVMDLGTFQWKRVAGYPGLNSGGAYAPDGGTVALILSKDGNPELYTMRLRGGQLTRVTQSPRVAEASPSWSPDGNRIVYVSNAAGLPHLYIITGQSGSPKRVNAAGSENVAPDWGPAGIVHSSRREGRYVLCVYDPSSGTDRQPFPLDALDSDEPSWAPNDRHIVYTRTGGYHSDIYILDLDNPGEPPVRLTTMQGEWYSPAWSPK